MDSLGMDPETFCGLHRWDRAALKYYSILKGHYEQQAIKQAKEDARREAKFSGSLPKVRRR